MIHPPTNPNAAEARAAMQAHNEQIGHEAWQELLERTFSRWPDMRRYADTARLESIIAWGDDGQHERIQVVTVTVFDKAAPQAAERKGEG